MNDGGCSLIQIEPSTKGLEFEPQAKKSKMAEAQYILSALDEEAAIWHRVCWRLLEEQFLFWYLWLKDNFEEIKEFVQEIKTAVGEVSDDSGQLKP